MLYSKKMLIYGSQCTPGSSQGQPGATVTEVSLTWRSLCEQAQVFDTGVICQSVKVEMLNTIWGCKGQQSKSNQLKPKRGICSHKHTHSQKHWLEPMFKLSFYKSVFISQFYFPLCGLFLQVAKDGHIDHLSTLKLVQLTDLHLPAIRTSLS